MSVKTLKHYIKQHGGLIISEATLLNSDLLAASKNVIDHFNLKPKFKKELEEILNHEAKEINYDPKLSEQASYLFNEDIFNYFNEISPAKFIFSSHPGDGSCFGFFKYSEEDIF